MKMSQELHEKYREFKELYLKECGVELSDKQAEKIGGEMLKLARLIHKHTNEKQNQKLQEEKRGNEGTK